MDKIIIEGQNPLSGTVSISGAKNAVLPIMTAALMADGISRIDRVPDLKDTRTMIKLMEIVGAKCSFEKGSLKIDGSRVDNPEAPYDLVKTMRASFYVLGPLLARFGSVKVSLPGGCAWGPRPVDFHLKGLEKLGAKITLSSGYIMAEAKRLKGAKISFEFPSVGATGNIVMAAATAEGTTVIENAAREPEIVDIVNMLKKMGANISGEGTSEIIIEGVKKLNPKRKGRLVIVYHGVVENAIKNYQSERQAYYERLKHFSTFGKGWTRRVTETTETALSWK